MIAQHEVPDGPALVEENFHMRAACTLALAGLALAATVATATAAPVSYPIDWTLKNVGFSDGGTASGTFAINQYGQLQTFDVTTTTGSALSGYVYTPVINALLEDNDTVLILNRTGYDGYLDLTFLNPLSTPASYDPIVAAVSYECNGFQQVNGSCGTRSVERTVTSGGAVPEPMTVVLFGTALLGIGYVRRRG
jgi:hypothetical protein